MSDTSIDQVPLTPEEEQRQAFIKSAIKQHTPDSDVDTQLMRNSQAYRNKVWEEGGIYTDEGGRRYFRSNRGWQNNLKTFRPTPTGGFWTFDGEQKFWVDFTALQMRYHADLDPLTGEDKGGHYRIWATVKNLQVAKRGKGKRKTEYIWDGTTKTIPLSYWFASESEIRAAMAKIKETHQPLIRYNPNEHYTYCPDDLIEYENPELGVTTFLGTIHEYQPQQDEIKWQRIFAQNELCEMAGVDVIYGDVDPKQWTLGPNKPCREAW